MGQAYSPNIGVFRKSKIYTVYSGVNTSPIYIYFFFVIPVQSISIEISVSSCVSKLKWISDLKCLLLFFVDRVLACESWDELHGTEGLPVHLTQATASQHRPHGSENMPLCVAVCHFGQRAEVQHRSELSSAHPQQIPPQD